MATLELTGNDDPMGERGQYRDDSGLNPPCVLQSLAGGAMDA